MRSSGRADKRATATELPAISDEREGTATARPQPKTEKVVKKKQQPKVLIVEDTTELAEVIAITLERIDMRAFLETHVDRALHVYKTEHPDIILLDIGLPDKSGWKLLDAIRDLEARERPLVVVITAHGDPANRLMGKLQGVHGYLIKPFTTDEVEHIVTRVLAGEIEPPNISDISSTEPLPDFVTRFLEGRDLDSLDQDFDDRRRGKGEGKSPR